MQHSYTEYLIRCDDQDNIGVRYSHNGMATTLDLPHKFRVEVLSENSFAVDDRTAVKVEFGPIEHGKAMVSKSVINAILLITDPKNAQRCMESRAVSAIKKLLSHEGYKAMDKKLQLITDGGVKDPNFIGDKDAGYLRNRLKRNMRFDSDDEDEEPVIKTSKRLSN